jgi:hypothetical protein
LGIISGDEYSGLANGGGSVADCTTNHRYPLCQTFDDFERGSGPHGRGISYWVDGGYRTSQERGDVGWCNRTNPVEQRGCSGLNQVLVVPGSGDDKGEPAVTQALGGKQEVNGV